MASLPETMKAIVVHGHSDGRISTIPVPAAGPGSIVVRVLHSLVHNNTANIYHGTTGALAMTSPWPCVPGGYFVGRVAALGPDATAFEVGQVVICEPFVRARDDPEVAILWGGFDGITPKTKKFAKDNWRNGSWAEYVRTPLENAWPINEDKVLGTLGLRTQDLAQVGCLAVVYAGMRKINLQAGETVVIAPATGIFSGGAVHVAKAMGANVVAASRNAEGLKRLAELYPGTPTVQLTGTDADTASLMAHGPIDAFIDVSPAEATNAPHLGHGMMAVRSGGRICLLGGRGDTSLPIAHGFMILRNLTIRGSWMYEAEHMRGLIKMVESGTLRLDKEAGMEVVEEFALEQFEEALERARKSSTGKMIVMNS